MNIKIIDKVGFSESEVFELAQSLFKNRPPKENNFDYGFETHGAVGLKFMSNLEFPIQVYQTNKRLSDKSPIYITIEKHTRI